MSGFWVKRSALRALQECFVCSRRVLMLLATVVRLAVLLLACRRALHQHATGHRSNTRLV
jgi:hypothetical protein